MQLFILVESESNIAAASDLSQAGFALDITAKALLIYEADFDIEYPPPKLDTLLVRLPQALS